LTRAPRAAELLDALPEPDVDTQMSDAPEHNVHPVFAPNPDPVEAALEAQELGRYLLAKSFFDCKEFERCAAVFLPEPLLASLLGTNPNETPANKGKGKARTIPSGSSEYALPEISQKSMFLALYAKVIAGEKHKDEDTEMIMGPQDSGAVVNKQLVIVSRFLTKWFAERKADDGDYPASQGFLEYLYGMVLAKEKNDNLALDYLMQSVHLFPWNWGAWQEITNLVSRVEQVSTSSCPTLAVFWPVWTNSSDSLTKSPLTSRKTSCPSSSTPTPQ
jgi:anaphase-promoting complex subunit 8